MLIQKVSYYKKRSWYIKTRSCGVGEIYSVIRRKDSLKNIILSARIYKC